MYTEGENEQKKKNCLNELKTLFKVRSLGAVPLCVHVTKYRFFVKEKRRAPLSEIRTHGTPLSRQVLFQVSI